MDRNRTKWNAVSRAVLEEDGGVCQCCGSPDKLRMHHIIPLSDGGDKVERGNLLTLCRPCELQVHEEFMNCTGTSGTICGTPYMSMAAVYNIAILREMRLNGRRTDGSRTHRDDFLARRAKLPTRMRRMRRMSHRAMVLCTLLDAGVENVELPKVIRFDGFEVEVRENPNG